MTKEDVDALLEGEPNDTYGKVMEARLRTMPLSPHNANNGIREHLGPIMLDPKLSKKSHIEVIKHPMYKDRQSLAYELVLLERDNQGLLSDDLKSKLKEHPDPNVKGACIYSFKLSDEEIDEILHRKEIAGLEEQGMSRDDAAKKIYQDCDYSDYDKISDLAGSICGYDESVTDDIYKYAMNLSDEGRKDDIIETLIYRRNPISSDRINDIFENYKDKTGNTVIESLLRSERPLPDKIIDHIIEKPNSQLF